MIFPCKMQLSDMQAMDDGTFFCNSCATKVTDVRDNTVPIQNIKCGIFNVTDIEFKPIHIQTQAFQVARISVLALVGLIAMPESTLLAQNNVPAVNVADSLIKLKFPIMVKGRVVDENKEPLIFATVILSKKGIKSTKGTTTDEDGRFQIQLNEEDCVEGMFELIVFTPGYKSDTVKVKSDVTKRIKIELKPVDPKEMDVIVVTGKAKLDVPEKKSPKRKSED